MRKILILTLMIGVFMGFRLNIKAYDIPDMYVDNINLYSTYYAVSIEWEIPEGIVYVEVDIPIYTLLKMTQTGSGIKSSITFSDENDMTIETYNFENLGGRIHGLFRFILSEYDVTGARYVNILLVHDEGVSLPSGIIDNIETNVILKADEVIKFVRYYSQGSIYATSMFIDVPVRPSDPTPPTGYIFNGWVKANGEPYTFRAVAPEEIIVDTFYLYADFVPSSSEVIVPEPSSNVPTGLREILALARLDNTEGYGVFYVLIAVVIIGLMSFFLKANALIIGIAELVWLSLSLFLGLLSLWIAIAVGLFIVMVIMYMMNKGDNYES